MKPIEYTKDLSKCDHIVYEEVVPHVFRFGCELDQIPGCHCDDCCTLEDFKVCSLNIENKK